MDALRAAGAEVLVAHTEQRSREWLYELQDAGLAGVEVFNLRVAVAVLEPLDERHLQSLVRAAVRAGTSQEEHELALSVACPQAVECLAVSGAEPSRADAGFVTVSRSTGCGFGKSHRSSSQVTPWLSM